MVKKKLKKEPFPMIGKDYIRVKGYYKKVPRSGATGAIIDFIVGPKKVYVKGYIKKIDKRKEGK